MTPQSARRRTARKGGVRRPRRHPRLRGVALREISDIRRFFHRNEIPIYFISATNFNLLGMDEWVRNFKHISYIDCYDGRHPNVFVPGAMPHAEFGSIEEINNYMLAHPDVRAHIRGRGRGGVAVFLMFDDRTETLARQAGLRVWFPRARLRSRVDNKIETVRIGNKAGVPSVPNVLAKVDSWETLRKVSRHLGESLVVQTAFGDSGHTTFFIRSRRDYQRHAHEIAEAPEVKIMKRIKCRPAAIEACATHRGTVVGPLMTELVGFRQLTPYRGGWCGNEIFAGAFTPALREKASHYAFAFGEQLRKEGYRGYFELDLLIEEETHRLYLGELNPRITGASSMTNHAAFAHADCPLFLFHLLEFSGVDFELDVDALNHRWADPRYIDSWSQLVIKHTEPTIDRLVAAPQSGIYRMDRDGNVGYDRFDYHRRAIQGEREAFFLRISGAGDYRYEGADLGILVTRGRLMTDRFKLNRRARRWIAGLRAAFAGEPLPSSSSPQPGAFKLL
jgi:hypothetical protein